jgi:hypothetical protein
MAGLLLVAEIADKEMDMEKQIRLLHSTHKSNIDQMLRNGLKATSSFDDLDLEMRRGVVYCWLKKEHDKMWGQRADYVYVQVTVDKNRCRVADMDFISIAMMYLQGSKGKPKNEEAAQLLGDLYRITSVPLSEYTEGMFWTPEVLVKGDIDPDYIRLISET